LHLCEGCSYRYLFEREYAERVPEVGELADMGDYEAALKVSRNLLSSYVEHDRHGFFKTRVMEHEALILLQGGRLDEGLEMHRSLSEAVKDDRAKFLDSQGDIAEILVRMGKRTEAVTALGMGLDLVADSPVPNAPKVLALYAERAEPDDLDIPERYCSLFTKLLDLWGIQVPPELSSGRKARLDRLYCTLRTLSLKQIDAMAFWSTN
jgi:hypothetical protein